ncbi:methyltransferase domain-containing protein [Algoriphagus machipongonensis]|uniref:Uncharacterized protein n=1 Tax=Algoriphagus machipongonensis TaxID=388413 RepID=A3HXW9_9BACT|nr:class I SAM-dependent methyltransferase [Algoriphagus machipongonensis]EAZ81442.1 hypothetical protein ALPR1_20438 [Algoriphagus machipongonensis]
MKDDYGFIAPYYNRLAKMLFGKKLWEAKNCFVSEVEDKKILIIGGGDGFDYKEVSKNLSGQYWDKSQRMLDLAKENLSESELSFHLGEFTSNEKVLFDEIWLHFVLDTMDDQEISSLINGLSKVIQKSGSIYFADFFKPISIYQKGMHLLMIQFFRVFAGHKRKNIPDYEKIFLQNSWKKSDGKSFMKGWIRSQIWKPVL